MGTSFSTPKSIERPVELHVFKQLDGVPFEYNIPEVAEKRKPTDQFFLIVFNLMTLLLVALSSYTLCFSDMNRMKNGYDNCGNVCGEKNAFIEDVNCTGKDYSEEKILLYKKETALLNLNNLDMQENECVAHCNETQYMKLMNRCFKLPENKERSDKEIEKFLDLVIDDQLVHDLQNSTGYIVGMVFFSLGTCYVMLLIYKYFLNIFVKTLMVLVFLLMTGFTIFTWTNKNFSIGFSIIITTFCVIIDIGIIIFWKRLNFVVKIFNEATRAVFAMPFLMLVPISIFLFEVALTILLFYLLLHYYTSGILIHLFGEFYTYAPTSLMMFTIVYTIIFYIYLCSFLHGCQQIIVAGSISTWYFTREKDQILGSPIYESFKTLIKYHLGSVAFGSLVITIVKIMRAIARGMLKKRENICFHLILNCCLDFWEEFIHYISDQAYIMIAMHGQPFIQSGKRATKLLIDNTLNTLAINTAGDFVLWVTQILVVILTVLCGIILDDGKIAFYGVVLVIGAILSALLANCIFRNFEICVDTIFLCYCEDTFIHDGNEQPYYAPVNLVTLVEEVKGVIENEKMYNSVQIESAPPPDFV